MKTIIKDFIIYFLLFILICIVTFLIYYLKIFSIFWFFLYFFFVFPLIYHISKYKFWLSILITVITYSILFYYIVNIYCAKVAGYTYYDKPVYQCEDQESIVIRSNN